MGVLGDLNVWSLDTLPSSADAEFERRLVHVKNLPFAKGSWTHIAITYSALGTAESVANLYMNGNEVGTINGIDDPFTWELEKANINLGLNFIGLMDELSIFNRPLTPDEVRALYELEEGVKSVL